MPTNMTVTTTPKDVQASGNLNIAASTAVTIQSQDPERIFLEVASSAPTADSLTGSIGQYERLALTTHATSKLYAWTLSGTATLIKCDV